MKLNRISRSTNPGPGLALALTLIEVAAGLVFILLLSAGQARAAQISGQVVRVIDGDTVEVLAGGRPTRIRLAAIDAPETKCGQPFGEASKRSLAAMIAGRQVTVSDQGRDRYGRMIGFIVADGLDVNAEQVRRGYAWHYVAYSHDLRLSALEASARAARRGLWGSVSPAPPWSWRSAGVC